MRFHRKLQKCSQITRPWITKRIKSIINRKKLAFQKNDKEEYKVCTKGTERGNLKEKEQYKQKVESHLMCNNMRCIWSDTKLMSRYVNGNTQKVLHCR